MQGELFPEPDEPEPTDPRELAIHRLIEAEVFDEWTLYLFCCECHRVAAIEKWDVCGLDDGEVWCPQCHGPTPIDILNSQDERTTAAGY